MAKPIPYDDDEPEQDERDMRKIVLYDDEVLQLMQGWTGGETDPLYAISSTGGWNYAWVFSDAIANIDRDLSRVKKLGRNKYQLGKGTFSKKEIDELAQIRDALAYALEDPESVLVDEAHGVVRTPRAHHVADINPALIEAFAADVDEFRESQRITFEQAFDRLTKPYWLTQYKGDKIALENQIISRAKSIGRARQGGVRAPRHVRDYEAIDRQDRVIAGPFKSYGDAKDAAGSAGAVRFVPSKGKPSRATEVHAGRPTIDRITKAYVRTYGDTGQTKAYVEWIDTRGKTGRTEGDPNGMHMKALLDRARREGVHVEQENWGPKEARETRSAHNPSPTRRRARARRH